jgi:hypothetical protein
VARRERDGRWNRGESNTELFEKYGEAATQRNFVGRLLKFNKYGEFRAGQDEQEIPRGTVLAAMMPTLCVGFVKWIDNQRAEVIMGPVAEGFMPPKRAELGNTDPSSWDTFDDGRPRDPYQFSNSLVFADLETNELFTFSTGSKGGLSAIGELSKAYGRHIRTNPDELPLIELDVGSYQHSNRSYGEIRFPIVKMKGWIHADKLPPIDGVACGEPTREEPALLLEPAPEPVKAAARTAVGAARKKF